jgi:leucyl aminopeptidase
MRFKYHVGAVNDIKIDTIVCFVTEFNKVSDKTLKSIDGASSGSVTTLLESEEFTGKNGEVAVLYNLENYKANRIVLLGLGTKKELSHDSFRKATGVLSRHKAVTSSSSVLFNFAYYDKPDFYQGAIEGLILGSFKYLNFKSSNKEIKTIKELVFAVDSRKYLNRLEKATVKGQIIAEGQNLVRELGTIPGNYLNPTMFANRAKQLSSKYKLRCKILGKDEIVKEKMGALLSVSAGSAQPPRFMILEYKGAPANRKPVVLVGKGVTFDSGGISLKQSLGMQDMKGDMCGAASVLAAIVTASRLKIQQNVIALIPATENLPSGTATKPGDIVTSRKGLTIEVINTDAEGRLILADALDYANKFDPQAVIDVATLTGATTYILGSAGIPFMTNNKRLKDRIFNASTATSEKVWELPIWDEHREQMKSSVADLVNSGGRQAGTIAAGAFLEYFIGDYNWAHIDIASVDQETKGKAYTPKGITGIGMRLLVEVLSNWKKL